MRVKRIITLDFTGGVATPYDATGESAELIDDLSFPLSVVISKNGDTLSVQAGQTIEGLREDEDTLIFDHLNESLPDFEDDELLSVVITALWNALADQLSTAFPAEVLTAYVVPDYRYPPLLLERIQAVCAASDRLKLAGFISEQVSFLVGFINTPFFQEQLSQIGSSTRVTFCGVAADEERVDAVCFDWWLDQEGRRCLMIRDFFRTRADLFAERLKTCEDNHSFSNLISIESPALTEHQGSLLEEAFAECEATASRTTADDREIKAISLKGAARLARARNGRASDEEFYSIGVAYQVGPQIDRLRFHPVISSDHWTAMTSFPVTAGSLFRVRRRTSGDTQIFFYCGHTDSIKESTLVTSIAPSRARISLPTASSSPALGAKLVLTARGSGEATLEVQPGSKEIGTEKVVLPGLVN